MSMGEIDISWQALRRIVQEWAGTSAELTQIQPLHGGYINTTLALHTKDGGKSVIKVSPHRVDRSYEREAIQLTLLKSLGLPVPEVYRWKIGTLDDPVSYLLIEFIEGVDLHEAKRLCTPDQFNDLQTHLAEMVLSLHSNTSPTYLRMMEESRTFESWPRFYHHIYDTIWHDTEKSPLLPKGARKQIAKIHENLDRLIAHNDQPRLVHWDIWATNLLARPDPAGRWHISAFLDPACKYAHFEAEIAYMELFHTITPAFLKVYQQSRKLPPEYHLYRKPIYELYPLINHLHLFGQEYVKPLAAAVERASALV